MRIKRRDAFPQPDNPASVAVQHLEFAILHAQAVATVFDLNRREADRVIAQAIVKRSLAFAASVGLVDPAVAEQQRPMVQALDVGTMD